MIILGMFDLWYLGHLFYILLRIIKKHIEVSYIIIYLIIVIGLKC